MEAEVGIIGAGAAGGVIALELSRRGIDVVVLESGPRHDFARRPEYVRRYLRRENPWRGSPSELDRYTIGGPVAYRLDGRRARGVGGSTLHWEGYTLRLQPEDFRLRSRYGVADDWPISYQELEPYYAAAETSLGVAGAADDPWATLRSTPFPLPAFPFSYSDALFATSCKTLGIGFSHLPQARNSVAYGGRSQCRACGTCEVCPTGAKWSTDLAHIPQAEATGHARIVPETTALRLETRSGRVRAAIYAGLDKVERRLEAEVFVAAGGAVENARLLLLSASSDFPKGLANSSGLVGKFFMSHPATDVTGRASRKVYPYRIGFSTAMSRHFTIDRERARQGAFLLEFLNSAGPTPERLAVSSGLWGDALRQRVRDEFGHWLGIRVYTEQFPDRLNAISLNPRVRDYFGSPAPHIDYRLGRYERQAIDEAKVVATRILTTMGLTDIRATGLSFAGHQIGTHRMGTDPGTSVVDPNLQCHDVPNLYWMGSGCFVTASASPPTLTIAALAIRAAEHIAARLRPNPSERASQRTNALTLPTPRPMLPVPPLTTSV